MMHIRLATSADNEALISLTRASPMNGPLTVFVERSPDFFAFSKLQGESFEVWVAEDESKEIVGCITHVKRKVRYQNKIVQQLYVCDLKVHPKARGKKLGKALLKHYMEKAMKSEDCQMGEGEVIAKNVKPEKLAQWVGVTFTPVVNGGRARLYQLLPFKRYKVNPEYHVRVATPGDLPTIRDLLQKTYSSYNCAPLFEIEEIERELAQDPTFSLNCFRIAERSGKIAACCAFWDQSPLRRTVVQRFSTSGNMVKGGLFLLRPFLEMPPLPKPGQPLSYLYLKYPACDENNTEALQAILHHESNAVKKLKKYHFIWASFHEADPLQACVTAMWKLKMDVNLFHFSVQDSFQIMPPQDAPRWPTYVDFSIV